VTLQLITITTIFSYLKSLKLVSEKYGSSLFYKLKYKIISTLEISLQICEGTSTQHYVLLEINT